MYTFVFSVFTFRPTSLLASNEMPVFFCMMFKFLLNKLTSSA
jgi:hypothetical protein